MSFTNIVAGDPIIASIVMSNFRHVNFGSDLLPVDSSGVAVDNTLNLGSSSKRWGIGFFNNAYFSGNVGIGTQSVASLGTSITTLGIRGGTTARTGGLYLDSSDSSVKFAMYGATSDSATLPFALGTTTNHGFRFVANNANVGCVDASGNFGIGTTSPAYKLDVQSGFGVIARFNFNDATYNPRLAISGSSSGIMFNLDYSTAASNIMFGIGGTEYFRFNSAGLGIGTTTVSAKLHVISTGTIFRGGYDASNYIGLQVGSTGDATFSLTGTTPKFQFSNRMEITPAASSGIQEALRLIDSGTGASEGSYIRWDSASRTDMARIGAIGETTGGGIAFYTNSANSGAPTLRVQMKANGAVVISETLSVTNQQRAEVSNSTNITILDSPSLASATVLTFDTEIEDVGGFHSTVSYPGRFTAPETGTYLVDAVVLFLGTSGAARTYLVQINGDVTTIENSVYTTKGFVRVPIIARVSLSAGQNVYLAASQNSGSNIEIDGSATSFRIYRLP